MASSAGAPPDMRRLNGIITAYPQAKDDLEGLRAQLDAAAGFYNGIVEYTQGVSSAYDGIKSLGQGASMLKDGLYELSGSSASLSEGAGELSLGLYSLSGGFNELVSGSGRLRAETAGIEEKRKPNCSFRGRFFQKILGRI